MAKWGDKSTGFDADEVFGNAEVAVVSETLPLASQIHSEGEEGAAHTQPGGSLS